MAALATRAYLARSEDDYACPLSAVQLNAEQLRALLQPVWSGEQEMEAIERTNAKGGKRDNFREIRSIDTLMGIWCYGMDSVSRGQHNI